MSPPAALASMSDDLREHSFGHQQQIPCEIIIKVLRYTDILTMGQCLRLNRATNLAMQSFIYRHIEVAAADSTLAQRRTRAREAGRPCFTIDELRGVEGQWTKLERCKVMYVEPHKNDSCDILAPIKGRLPDIDKTPSYRLLPPPPGLGNEYCWAPYSCEEWRQLQSSRVIATTPEEELFEFHWYSLPPVPPGIADRLRRLTIVITSMSDFVWIHFMLNTATYTDLKSLDLVFSLPPAANPPSYVWVNFQLVVELLHIYARTADDVELRLVGSGELSASYDDVLLDCADFGPSPEGMPDDLDTHRPLFERAVRVAFLRHAEPLSEPTQLTPSQQESIWRKIKFMTLGEYVAEGDWEGVIDEKAAAEALAGLRV